MTGIDISQTFFINHNGLQFTSNSLGFGTAASAGDFNGDGKHDIVISAYRSKIIYVVYGNNNKISNPFNVDEVLNSTNGFKITSNSDGFGGDVDVTGDFNNDGINDIIISAGASNCAYVVYGSKNRVLNIFNVDNLDGTNGFKITGSSASFGNNIAYVGDFNGDKKSDIMIGAPTSKSAYLIYGVDSNVNFDHPFMVDSRLTGAKGFKLTSASLDFAGLIRPVGDLNFDNKSDIIAASGSNVAYIIYGSSDQFSTPFNVESLDGMSGFKIIGNDLYFGSSAAVADFSNDGTMDIIIGASGSSSVYVIYGRGSGRYPNPFDVNQLDGTNGGFKITSGARYFGCMMASVDFNNDHKNDVLIGSSETSAPYNAYVMYGGSTFTHPFNIDTSVNGTNGIKFTGASSNFGRIVNAGGDFNSDGNQDIIISASDAQTSYIIYGNSPICTSKTNTSSVNFVYIVFGGIYGGTAGNDKFIVISQSEITLTTGAGQDEIVLYPNSTASLFITDFDQNNDKISLSGFSNTECQNFAITS